jgi:hypothetical protein
VIWAVANPAAVLAQTAQPNRLEENTSGRSGSIFLRGTTGSGEQKAVFGDDVAGSMREEEDGAQDGILTATPSARDTSDPVRQLQGRALSVQPEPPVLDPLRTDDPGARSNVRAATVQQGTGAAPLEDPFTATGIRIGSWRAFINAEQTLGYSTNIRSEAMGDGGAFSQSDVSVSLQSDWSRHRARLDANGSWRTFLDDDSQDLPSADVSAGITFDLIDGVSADAEATYSYSTESATSRNINSSAVNRPGVHSTGVAAGVARSDRKLVYSLRGSVGRTDYGAIELAGGGEESQGDRNNTLYTLTGRVGYQTSPALTPFIEGSLGWREYDKELDRNGQNRDSVIVSGAVGTSIGISEKLQGEIALGYQNESFEDDDLDNLDGWTLNGNLTWSPQRETTVNLTASTEFSGSTTAGEGGSIVNRFGAGVERQVNSRLSLNADSSVEFTRQDDGSASDIAYSVGGGFDYWINRFLGLTGRVEHSVQRSSEGASQEYDETIIRGGLRFQR